MLKMIQFVKFKQVNNPFLNNLKEDTEHIKNEPKLLFAADKTTNFYKLEPSTYNDLLEKNITKSYKKALPETTQAIHKENKDIATKLGIDDGVDTTASKDAFITLKDHKPNFANKPTCRLINPTKSEIGKVSKKILDRINSTIAKKHNLHQWKNTAAVIDWFKSIKNKQRLSFICFDIEEFYPSISQDLLIKALDFASDYDNITTDERNIIIHAKSSILIHHHQPWQKKGNTTFDVTMGSYYGAETCQLVGNFLLSQLQDLNINVGLYRDDGLAITDATPRDTENIKKEICRTFNNNGLRITIEANKQVITSWTSHLTLTEALISNSQNRTLHYNTFIAHQQTSLSSDKTSFDQAAPPYQKALDGSGYRHILNYQLNTPTKRKNRQRNNILWYNPPFSKNVSTNIGHRFLALVHNHFPRDHKLRKIFNRNTIKISYSWMKSTKEIIDNHNKRILNSSGNTNVPADNTKNNKTCNCRQKNACPLTENCLESSVVYQATVTRNDNNTAETYIGLTENDFKTRYRNHTASFRHTRLRNSTELSKHIWTLKDSNIDHFISWRILSSSSPYNSASKRCCVTAN